KRKIIYLIRNRSEDKKAVNEVIDFVKKSGGLDYAKEKMNGFYQEALAILKEFPDSTYKTSLRDLVSYTIERRK
ncbi:MAG: polyprenyl synthetase family protein, partial [Cyclobacteriaceae bacterium]|nr:polyprenyl synthetase family protein [Cyclobacteriaceae bacterium]